ncbi:MAG TPA: 50S ribosomal protein L6 [Candidatus Paceibacterota bacterium]|nr:50S ribosomal protein L6 [Candidatus Paceibacterota bacterium]HPT40044.1 50S ribosomal protein L6 [Candidatus Paceibacterota bacterium]
MSKIGKQIIILPEKIEAKIEDSKIIIKGPKGELSVDIIFGFKVEINEKDIKVIPESNFSKKKPALWGTLRALINNAVIGVSKGFEKKLEIEGIGFKAALDGQNLSLNVGFSHPVKFPIPEGIKITIEKNLLTISGISKDLVGRTAADIRAIKKPEPYKGKGIHYVGEVIRRKSGKKAAGTTA